MTSAIFEEDSTWNIRCTPPLGNQSRLFLVKDGLSKNFDFLVFVKLGIGVFFVVVAAPLTNLGKLLIAVWHLFNWHVRIVKHTLHGSLTLSAHLSKGVLSFLRLALFLLFSHLFHESLLALFFNEFDLEGVEQGLLIWTELFDFGLGSSVSNCLSLRVRDLKIDSNKEKLCTLLSDEFKEVLALALLQLLCVLQDDELELDDGLKFSHISLPDIKIGLVKELLAVSPAVQIALLWVDPVF